MFKDDSKSVDMFPPAVSSEEVSEVIPAPFVDISDCDTFTDIVNKLENGQGYANLSFLGSVASSGTAYPLSVKDDMLYSGGNHHGAEFNVVTK